MLERHHTPQKIPLLVPSQPLVDPTEIASRLNVVEALLPNSLIAETPHKHFSLLVPSQPLVDPTEIASRLNVVEALVSDVELRERLRDQHLRGECLLSS